MAWTISHILPMHLRESHFELTEDEDFVILWHERQWVGRFYAWATNLPAILDTATDHLLQHHAGRISEAVEA